MLENVSVDNKKCLKLIKVYNKTPTKMPKKLALLCQNKLQTNSKGYDLVLLMLN